MTILEIVILGYVLNFILMFVWVVYALLKLIITVSPEQLIFRFNALEERKARGRGAWLFPFAVIVEVMVLIKKEIDFNTSYPNKSFMDFLETLMDD